MQTEAALRKSEAKFKEIFETIEDLYCQTDSKGIIRILSPSLYRLTGWDKKDLLGKPATMLYVNPGGRERLLLKLSEKGYIHDYEVLLKKKNGKEQQASLSARLIVDENGQSAGVSGLLRDITERKRAEEALQESETLQCTLLANLPAGVMIIDPVTRIIENVNNNAAAMFGVHMEHIVGHRCHRFLCPAHEGACPVCDLGKEVDNAEREMICADGSRRPVLKSVKRIQIGGHEKLLECFFDIAEHKRTEEALRESELRFRTLFDSANDAIFIMKDHIIFDCNCKASDIFYCSKEDIIGCSPVDFSPETQPDGLLSSEKATEKINMALEGSPQFFEWKHRRMDGTAFDTEVSLNSIELGNNTYLQAIIRDITDRKQAEEEITKKREKLKTLSDNAPFGMVLIQKNGRFTYINKKYTELFGYDLSDTPDGRTWCRRAYPDAGYRQMVISAWRESLKDAKPGEQKTNIFTVTCKDMTQKIVQFIFSILASGDYLMTCENITELKYIESQLRQAQKMEAIGTMAGGIAHDFNNILTALMGYATLIQMKMNKGSPLRSYVDQILSASGKAADLTQSLLSFSRKQPVTLAPLDVNDAINATRKLLKRLLTDDIALHTSLTKEDTIVMADKSQMDQILFNLATNARDAMPKGGTLTIETAIATIDNTFIKVHGFGKPGKYVQLNIMDTGEGMDEATQSKIFDPFFTTKETGKGTGLGLATVYGIVKQHNGYITVDSTPRQGTTFCIHLPEVGIKVDREQNATTPVERGKETILIAEDNTEVRHLMQEALRQYDYKTIEAIDGEDAVDKFREHPDIDLVIIDSVMPKKNGQEVYEEIRGIKPRIKTLFTSGYANDIVLDKGIRDKESDFIAKPLLLNDLLQKVREMLDR